VEFVRFNHRVASPNVFVPKSLKKISPQSQQNPTNEKSQKTALRMTENIKFRFGEGNECCTNLILGLVQDVGLQATPNKSKATMTKSSKTRTTPLSNPASSQHHTNESDPSKDGCPTSPFTYIGARQKTKTPSHEVLIPNTR
jgi:hypothetical protein